MSYWHPAAGAGDAQASPMEAMNNRLRSVMTAPAFDESGLPPLGAAWCRMVPGAPVSSG
jgi:hypothetical protein